MKKIQHPRSKAAIGFHFALLGLASATLVACGGNGHGDSSSNTTSPGTGPVATVPTLQIQALSSKPDYVSDGDVLIAVKSSTNDPITLNVNGTPSTAVLRTDPADTTRSIAVLTGLKVGANTVQAVSAGATTALELTNYPRTGPILSGPHITPFICQTDAFTMPDGTKLGASTDANCSAPTKVQYVYRRLSGGALVPMTSTTALPSDVAMTTNTKGVQVPFVVRVETGTMNRGIYQNAVLHDPTTDAQPSPTTPPKGWNRRLIANHGSGCVGGWYIQGAALGVSPLSGDNLTRLSEGYAIFINTLNHPTNSCNATLAGETTMMGKEHFIETFGVPYYTVSTGGSGGAYTSLQVADAYPGIFDGVLISSTFPDALSISIASLDDKLISKYLNASNTAAFTEPQMVAVSGHKSARSWYDSALQSGRTDPVPNRVDPTPASPNPALGGYKSAVWNAAVPVGLRYDPVSNPTGARPTVFDISRNIYGIDKRTGFALRPFDNVGIQYGLTALNAQTITPTQFIDLNEQVGGYDQDGNYIKARSIGDAGAIKRAHQSGLQLSGGGGLASIPVFDFSGLYDEDQFYHYQWFHFAVRDRMAKTNGDTKNHVMWRGGGAIGEALGSPTPIGTALNTAVGTQSWAMFVKWMEAYKNDASAKSQREKVIADKPSEAVDGCFTPELNPQFIAEPQTRSALPNSQCNKLYPSWSVTRIEAGGPASASNLKCQLKPIAMSDYGVAFTPAEMTRLNNVFSSGVCDWSKPGLNETAVVPYASFGPSPVNLVFQVNQP
ncbi:MAG: DUF6351 family protein [Janthinobacterium lividum]